MVDFKIDMAFLEKRPLSYSSLKAFMRSPAHYRHYITTPKAAPTDALRMGQLIDMVILTPDEVEQKVVVMPEINRRTNVGKEEYAIFMQTNVDKLVVSQEDMDTAMKIKESVWNNVTAMYYLNQVTQTQRFVRRQIYGLPFIAIKDAIGPRFIMDLKSTKSAYEQDFNRDIFNYDYDLQGGIYTAIERDYPDYYILAVEKEEPYGCAVFHLQGDILQNSKELLQTVTENFKYCMEENLWDRSYDFWQASGIFLPKLPYWKRQ